MIVAVKLIIEIVLIQFNYLTYRVSNRKAYPNKNTNNRGHCCTNCQTMSRTNRLGNDLQTQIDQNSNIYEHKDSIT